MSDTANKQVAGAKDGCNCKKELEAKLTERFAAKEPLATNHSVELQGYGFGIVDNAMKIIGCMEAQATATFPLKNGGTKVRKATQKMVFSFCPFCGGKA